MKQQHPGRAWSGTWKGLTAHVAARVVACLTPLAVSAAPEPPPVIDRPIEVFWGSYQRNEHLVDTGAAGWSTVRQHLDGMILHGAYWNSATNSIGSPSPNEVGPKLAMLLNQAGGRKIIMEHGLAGAYPNVETAFGTSYAGKPTDPAGFTNGIGNIKRIMGYGFPQPEISTDYIMRSWWQTVRAYPAWTSKEFFTALVGPWETYDGTLLNPSPGSSDRMTYGWFRQWVEGLAAAFPDIRVTSTNSPVYFNWDEGGVNRRELSESFNAYYTWLKLERRGNHVTALFSGDGQGWSSLASAEIPLGASPVAGMFVGSTDANRLAQARFDNVRVLPCYDADLGRTGGGGSITLNGSVYTLKSHGNNTLRPNNSNSDAHFFAWREWTGDGTFTVRLDSLSGSNPNRTNPAQQMPCAGISIRESSARNARQVSLFANLANQLEFQARLTSGGLLLPVSGSGSPLAGLGVAQSPRWLRLTRTGGTISASHSADGVTWTSFGNIAPGFPETIHIGMFADSEVFWEEATAAFSNVGFLAIPGVSFSGTNLGSAGTGSTSSVSSGVYTLKARGSGLAGAADGARLHSTAFSGDGTLVARLAWFADDGNNANPLPDGAQMGLTIRASVAADAPQLGMAFTPKLGVRALSRSTVAGSTALAAEYGVGEASIQKFESSYRPLLHYFTGNDFMGALHDAFSGQYLANFAGFSTDSPYAGYQKWKGSETNPDGKRHREKIILYERWLQQRGRQHQFIANSTGGNEFPGDTSTQSARDQWDAAFKRGSLRSIQLHQLEGGRPDRVLFESWYVGPFTMVPETKTNSFSNLALDGLKYLKGPGQNLDLALRQTGETGFSGENIYQISPTGVQLREWLASGASDATSFTVRIVNRGEVAALPVIHAHETGGDNWSTIYHIGTADVSNAVRSASGHVLTSGALYTGNELIAPGAFIDLTVNVQASAPSQSRSILIRAFWNPQDPSGRTRDAIELRLEPPTSPPPGGDDIFMTGNDPGNTSSFNSGQSWPSGVAPSIGNRYFTGAFEMRTPDPLGDGMDKSPVFAGSSLTVGTGGYFTYKRDVSGPAGTTYVSSFTFPNGGLILDGGTVRTNSGRGLGMILAGNLSVTRESTFHFTNTTTGTQTFDIRSMIMGSGPIRLIASGDTGTRPRFLVLSGDNSGFSGGFKIGEGASASNMQNAILKVNHANALGTGVLVLSYGAVDLNGFNVTAGGLLGNNASGNVIRNNHTAPATLSVGSNHQDSFYAGSLQNGVGTVALTKVGAGTLTLAGVNSYSGATNVTGGTLILDGAGNDTHGTVTVSGNARLGGNGSTPATVNVESGGKLFASISDWTGPAGSGFADLQVGSLAIHGNLGIEVSSPTDYQNFSEIDRVFPFLISTGGISGFEAANVTVVVHDSFAGNGTWSVRHNGNLLELIYTADASLADYASWAAQFPKADLAQLGGDHDGDGVSNFEEYAFGLDPIRGASVNPIANLNLTTTGGTFSYTRRTGGGLIYRVFSSEDLLHWTWEELAGQVVSGQEGLVETVQVTLPASTLRTLRFIRVEAGLR